MEGDSPSTCDFVVSLIIDFVPYMYTEALSVLIVYIAPVTCTLAYLHSLLI